MCDSSDPCCVSSPLGKAGCIAKGGTISNDPCNILNPMASATNCLVSKKANDLSGTENQYTLAFAILGAMVLFLGFGLLYLFIFSRISMGGGYRKLNILKSIRDIKWK